MDLFQVLSGIDSGIIYYNSLVNPESKTLKNALVLENASKFLWSKANLVYTKIMTQIMNFRGEDFFERVANKIRCYNIDVDHVSQNESFIGTLNYGAIHQTNTIPYREVKAYNLRVAKIIYAKRLFEFLRRAVPRAVYERYFAKDVEPFMEEVNEFDRFIPERKESPKKTKLKFF